MCKREHRRLYAICCYSEGIKIINEVLMEINVGHVQKYCAYVQTHVHCKSSNAPSK